MIEILKDVENDLLDRQINEVKPIFLVVNCNQTFFYQPVVLVVEVFIVITEQEQNLCLISITLFRVLVGEL